MKTSPMFTLASLFISLVFVAVAAIIVFSGVDYALNKAPCNARGGYYTNGQCVTGPVVVR